MRRLISIIGDASVEEGSPKYEMAFNLGKALVDNGYRVASGGLNGIMRAAFPSLGFNTTKFNKK